MNTTLEKAFYQMFLSSSKGKENYLLGVRAEVQGWKDRGGPLDVEQRVEAAREELNRKCREYELPPTR